MYTVGWNFQNAHFWRLLFVLWKNWIILRVDIIFTVTFQQNLVHSLFSNIFLYFWNVKILYLKIQLYKLNQRTKTNRQQWCKLSSHQLCFCYFDKTRTVSIVYENQNGNWLSITLYYNSNEVQQLFAIKSFPLKPWWYDSVRKERLTDCAINQDILPSRLLPPRSTERPHLHANSPARRW